MSTAWEDNVLRRRGNGGRESGVGGALEPRGNRKKRDWKVGWDEDTAGLKHQVKKFDLCLVTDCITLPGLP